MRTSTVSLFAAALLIARTASAAESFTVVEHAVSDTVIKVSGKDDGLGNQIVFANPVFDAANHLQVGHDQGYCVRVQVGKSWECFWTLTLKDGQITCEGPYADTGDSLLAVTGGTGRYKGARGSLTLHPRDAAGSAFDFKYELL